MIEFGENLKRSREAKDITQQTLADQLYVTRQAVSRWENGARYPDLLTAKKLAGLLDTFLDELLSGEEWNPTEKKRAHCGVPCPGAGAVGAVRLCGGDLSAAFRPGGSGQLYGGYHGTGLAATKEAEAADKELSLIYCAGTAPPAFAAQTPPPPHRGEVLGHFPSEGQTKDSPQQSVPAGDQVVCRTSAAFSQFQCTLIFFHYTLKRNSMMSPSLTTYSLPSDRYSPRALTSLILPPHSIKVSKLQTSARMNPRSKSEWILPAA